MKVVAFLLLIAVGRSFSCVQTGCMSLSVSLMQIGDGVCDLPCMTALCEFDGNDCASECLCRAQLLGNGVCDPGNSSLECKGPECGWDLGDCGYCSLGCKSY